MKLILSLCFLSASILSGQVLAHHSFAMFDQTKHVSLEGVVHEFQWTNPHAWIEINVPTEEGKSERWAVELNSPNNLKRQGWKRKSLKHGDKVTIIINPLRNGKHGGLFNQVTLPDGSKLGHISKGPINVPGK